MSAKPLVPATYRDIEALPANMVGELVRGVLHAHPRHRDDAKVRAEPFDAIELDLSVLWAR
jgi:hypothetical protein